MQNYSDTLEQILPGDIEAFEKMFRNLYPLMCKVANRILYDEERSKDIAQDAFVRLWQKLNESRDIFSVKSYLYTTVRHLSLNYLRDAKKEQLPGKLPEMGDGELKSVIIEEETIHQLYQAIHNLPPQSSRIILLTIRGYKNYEIAEQLGISVNTVKTLKYNALKSLRGDLPSEVKDILMLLFFW